MWEWFIGLVVERSLQLVALLITCTTTNSGVAKLKWRGERKRERERERGFGGGDGSGDGNLLSGGGFVVRSGEALLLTHWELFNPLFYSPPHTTTHTLITLDDDDDDENCVLTICILVELLQFAWTNLLWDLCISSLCAWNCTWVVESIRWRFVD